MPIKSKRHHKIRRIVGQVCDAPWLIRSDKADVIQGLLNLRAGGYELSRAEINTAIGQPPPERPQPLVINGIAILPLRGIIAPRVNLLTSISGGTSCEEFAAWFRAALVSTAVRVIVIDCDSPGGQVKGVGDLSDLIYASRPQKRSLAVANFDCDSGAYWIASAAGELVASPTSELGSIGVVRMHTETSKADAQAGITTTIMRIPEFKFEGNPYEPLSVDAKAHFEKLNRETYRDFVQALARNRGVSLETVVARFGQGRFMQAPEAVAAGMADRIATLEDVLRELSNPN